METGLRKARFTTGSIRRHVVIMACTGAIGLMAMFAVDLANLFYISLLGRQDLVAAVGFVSVVTFLQVSINIGLVIGVGALVSRTIGAGRMTDARRMASACLAVMMGVTALLGLATVLLLGPILDLLGAVGGVRGEAAQYLTITSPSLPLVGAAMGLTALLRAHGEARLAMLVMLSGAVATALLDPLFIFALHLDLTGAAIVVVLDRLLWAGLGLWAAGRRRVLGPFAAGHLVGDAGRMMVIAGPAILTNLATPVGAIFVTRAMAGLGPQAVAGQATIERLSAVAFALVYALTGAIGPIFGQNMGAGNLPRVRQTLRESLLTVIVTVFAAWILLAVGQDAIVYAFSAKEETAQLVRLFCSWLAPAFVFTGCLFVANAAFNNLGFPLLSTLFNWGRATLGTIPFVAIGVRHGPTGVLYGQALGSVVFGLSAMSVAFWVTYRLGARADGGKAAGGKAAGGKSAAASPPGALVSRGEA